MATAATPDEYRRIDKWRCKVADDCVAELRKLSVKDDGNSNKSTARSPPVTKDDSLVLYKPHTREEIFDDVNSHGKPVTIIRRYKSQKGSPPAQRKSAPHIVQVTEDPSSSSSDSRSQRAGTERATTTYRSGAGERTARYRDDHRSEHSYRTRRNDDDARRAHRRHKSEAATVVVPPKKSAQSSGNTLGRAATLRRMLKLTNKEIKIRSREDSAHGATRAPTRSRRSDTDSRARTMRARSSDGRDTSYSTRRGSGQATATRRGDPTMYRSSDTYSGSHAPSQPEPRTRDLRDARQHRRAHSAYIDDNDRGYDQDGRSSAYVSNTIPRRSKTLNRGSDHPSSRRSTYETYDVYDDARVDDRLSRIRRDVERYRAQARGYDRDSYDSKGRNDDYLDRARNPSYGYDDGGYDRPLRQSDRRRSTYSDHGYGR